jgi:hypothetical protein
MEVKDRICKSCHWNSFRWCSDSMKVANLGDCDRWKLIKLSGAAKKKQAVVMKAAHARDRQKKAKR